MRALLAILVALGVTCTGCTSRAAIQQAKEANSDAAAVIPPEDETAEEQPLPLEVIESGYSVVGDDNTIEYGVIIHNPNKTLAASFPTIKVDMRDAQSGVLGVGEQVLDHIRPGQTVAWGGSTTANGRKPARVTFSVVVDDENWESSDPSVFKGFEIRKPRLLQGSYGLSVTGELVNRNATKCDLVALSVIFRDKSGKIVSGDGGYVDNVPANGRVPFEVRLYRKPPSRDSVAVYAQEW